MRSRLQHGSNALPLLDGPINALKRLIRGPFFADHQKYDRARSVTHICTFGGGISWMVCGPVNALPRCF